jgi:hypothetical protein
MSSGRRVGEGALCALVIVSLFYPPVVLEGWPLRWQYASSLAGAG